jgi:hypothetical protein
VRVRRPVIPEFVLMVSAMWYLGARDALLRIQAVSVNMHRVRIHILIPINKRAVTV